MFFKELGSEAVVHALQVLEVREQLERSIPGSETDLTTPDMADGEKALLREMCNVSFLIAFKIRFWYCIKC